MERKQETIYCLCYFYNNFYFISFSNQLALFLFYITFLIKKMKTPVSGAPDGVGPCHGTVGNLAMGLTLFPRSHYLKLALKEDTNYIPRILNREQPHLCLTNYFHP